MAETREPLRRPPAHTARAPQFSHTHYLMVGLALAGLWLLSRDKSLLFHAVQMLAVMSVLTVIQIVLRRHAGEAPAYVRLISAKLVLVALAVGGEWVLAPATPRSNAIVATGLVVLVTVLGPILDRLAANQAGPATGPDQAYGSSPSTGIRPGRSTPGDVPRGPRSPNGRTRDRHHARAWLSRADSTRKDRSHATH